MPVLRSRHEEGKLTMYDYDELINRLHRYTENCVAYKLDADFASAVQEAADAIEELSKERKTGKWIFPTDIIGFGRCSECKALWNSSLITNRFFNICPRCGSYNGGDDDV